MKQVYIPNIQISASPGLCLGYVDDAGNSPDRSPTAKEAFRREQNAGRIKLSDFPDNIWVVVWFEFTKGSYRYPDGSFILFKDAWHVAFLRRQGNTVEIHDSEVHSGARRPYTAIAAVEAWFAIYGAKYVGWSTQCDGRKYVEEEKVRLFNEGDRVNKNLAQYGEDLGRFKFAVKMPYDEADYAIMKSDEFMEDALINRGDIENIENKFGIKLDDKFLGRPSKKLLYGLALPNTAQGQYTEVTEKLYRKK